MSFPRHREIFPSDGGASPAANAPAHRLDEFPAGYSSAGWSPPVEYQTGSSGQRGKEQSCFQRVCTLIDALRPQQRPRAQWCFRKPDHQCGSGPRAQCSDDRLVSNEARMISFGRLLFRTARADAGQMRRRLMPNKRRRVASLPVIEPNAAGIDIGATQVFVAVPADRDAEPVRCFETFTVELEKLAA
jgi:hypothetical protein